MQTLGTETTLVLLSIIGTSEYEKVLARDLRIPQDKLENILEEINSLILNPIITELSDTHKRNTGTEEEIEKEKSLETKLEDEDLVTQEIDPRFEKLPQRIKDIISSSNYGPKLYVLGKENNLTISQITNLEGLVTDTILGTIPPESFEGKARDIVGLPEEKLQLLVAEINDKILREVRNQVLGLENKPVIDTQKQDTSPLEKKVEELEHVALEKPEIGEDKPTAQAPQTTEQKDTPPTSTTRASVDSIVLKKLAGSVRSGGSITQYSLEGTTKNGVGDVHPVSNQPVVDPYRMPIE
jgi:hypothetical protein